MFCLLCQIFKKNHQWDFQLFGSYDCLSRAVSNMFLCDCSCLRRRISCYLLIRINDSGNIISQHKGHLLDMKKEILFLMNDWDLVCLLLSFLKAHQARVDRLKYWPARLVSRALGFLFIIIFLTFHFLVSVATTSTLSQGEEVFSTALQSSCNNGATGETKTFVNVGARVKQGSKIVAIPPTVC